MIDLNQFAAWQAEDPKRRDSDWYTVQIKNGDTFKMKELLISEVMGEKEAGYDVDK